MADKSPEELQLERDQFEFEKVKFAADQERRSAEVEKLRAERRKTILEAADLEVPYEKRPAYKAAIFQGAAVLVAVVSAVISVGTVEKVIEASKAEQAKTFAEQRESKAKVGQQKAEIAEQEAQRLKEKAEDQRDAALEAKQEAAESLEGLSAQKKDLKSKVDAFEAQLRDSDEKIAIQPTRDILAFSPVNVTQLTDVLAKSDDKYQEQRRATAESYTRFRQGTILDRLNVLSVLLKTSDGNRDHWVRDQGYRNSLITIGSPPIDHSTKNWEVLLNTIGSDQAAPAICGAYNTRWPEQIGGRESINFISTSFGDRPECMKALWDGNDPDGLPAAQIEVNYFPYATSFLASCAKQALRCAVELQTNFRMRSDARRFSNAPDSLTSLSMKDLPTVWGRENPLTVRIFTEHGLLQLRRCGRPIWELMRQQIYVGDRELSATCPDLK